MRTCVILVGLCLFLAMPVWAQPGRGTRIARKEMVSERRTALVIGNGAYAFSPLENPVSDARAMAEVLRGGRFEVIERINCDRREMRRAIREFGNRIKAGGVGLCYYAGHGLQVKGENYLIPVDVEVQAEDEVEDECIKASSVLRKMDSAGNRLNIVILDACRNNPFARSFRSSTRGLARMDAPTGAIVAYATAPGEVASDGAGDHGLYTSILMKHMQTPGLKIEEVFKNVRSDVVKATSHRQVPWESTSLIGDFYFILSDRPQVEAQEGKQELKRLRKRIKELEEQGPDQELYEDPTLYCKIMEGRIYRLKIDAVHAEDAGATNVSSENGIYYRRTLFLQRFYEKNSKAFLIKFSHYSRTKLRRLTANYSLIPQGSEVRILRMDMGKKEVKAEIEKVSRGGMIERIRTTIRFKMGKENYSLRELKPLLRVAFEGME